MRASVVCLVLGEFYDCCFVVLLLSLECVAPRFEFLRWIHVGTVQGYLPTALYNSLHTSSTTSCTYSHFLSFSQNTNSGSQTECPHNQFCYGGQTSCIKTHKVNVTTSWCGSTFDQHADCHQECPNGTDDECPDDESCWGDSPTCALLESKLARDEEMKSKLWCATSYKHLVEHCTKAARVVPMTNAVVTTTAMP